MLEHLGDKLVLQFGDSSIFGLDVITLIMSWVVMAIIIGLALWLRRGLNQDVEDEPSGRLVILEWLMDTLDRQFADAFENDRVKVELYSFVSTLFIFITISNWISIVPGFVSPTQDYNIPLSLALLVFFVSHFYGMKINGTGKYLKSFAEPYPFMLPMNLISEVAKPLSHSFRLFGNVFGGAVLITVLTAKLIPILLPAIFQGFYGLFIGAIQAFVFALLAVSYINVAVQS
ncbi:MAG: F0F1 ATP synthase subunit A [Candidatus Acetothermia bacterium]|nr:F0F1 ATP synthase subunit A [Candidatus Bipolaricaulota bacterium]